MSTDQADGIELVILEVIKNILCKVYSLSILTTEGKERKRQNPKGQSLGIFYKLERIFPFPGIQRNLLGMLTLKSDFESHFLRHAGMRQLLLYFLKIPI